jgi:hypothetical protein
VPLVLLPSTSSTDRTELSEARLRMRGFARRSGLGVNEHRQLHRSPLAGIEPATTQEFMIEPPRNGEVGPYWVRDWRGNEGNRQVT